MQPGLWELDRLAHEPVPPVHSLLRLDMAFSVAITACVAI